MNKRSNRLMNDSQREDFQRKMAEIVERLTSLTKKDEFHETYNEAIKKWLPENQRKYAEGQSFLFLCMQLKKFLEEPENLQENIAALKIAKENFELYCYLKEIKC